MVFPSKLDSKDEGRDFPKRKYVSNTVNHSQQDHSPTSEIKDNCAALPNQAAMTWSMLSVAVGLLTIFTMIEWIASKMIKEIDGSQKTEEQIKQQEKDTTDLTKNDIIDNDAEVETPQNDVEKSDDLIKSGDDSVNAEKTNDISDADSTSNNVGENILNKDVDDISGKCENLDDEAAVHVGPGFLGNYNINTKAFPENREDASTESEATSYDECCCTTETSRTTATLQNNNLNHTTAVTVNHLQTKCFSCNAAETPKIIDTTSNLGKDLTAVVAESRNDEFLGENKSPNNISFSSIKFIKTPAKSLSIDVPPVFCEEPERFCTSDEKSQSNVETHSDSNSVQLRINDREMEKSEFSSQNVYAENKELPHQAESKNNTESNVDAQTASNSLNFFANYHTPQDNQDGCVLSKGSDDLFIFPQDNGIETENRPINISEKELDTPRSKVLRIIRNDPEFSKSLDSQIEILRKGCELLGKKPSKSSIRTSGSEGNLKKFVHFPEDIRNIRTVHKYHSFESLYDNPDVVEDDTKNIIQ